MNYFIFHDGPISFCTIAVNVSTYNQFINVKKAYMCRCYVVGGMGCWWFADDRRRAGDSGHLVRAVRGMTTIRVLYSIERVEIL